MQSVNRRMLKMECESEASEEIDFDMLNELLSVDEDDDDDTDDEVIPKKKVIPKKIDLQLSKVNKLKMDQNLSNVTTTKVLNLINDSPGVAFKTPATKFHVQQSATNNSELDKPIIYVFCETCERIVLNNQLCSACKTVAKKDSKKNNFMVHFPLIPQIKRLLKIHFDAIMSYKNRDRVYFSDYDDGKLYRAISESLESNLVALTLNADGASLSNSGGKQLWPVQMYLNCLPPKLRYLHENIIVTTLYFAKKSHQ